MNLGSQSRKFNARLWVGIQYWPELSVDCYGAALAGISFMGPSSQWSIFRSQATPLLPKVPRRIARWTLPMPHPGFSERRPLWIPVDGQSREPRQTYKESPEFVPARYPVGCGADGGMAWGVNIQLSRVRSEPSSQRKIHNLRFAG